MLIPDNGRGDKAAPTTLINAQGERERPNGRTLNLAVEGKAQKGSVIWADGDVEVGIF